MPIISDVDKAKIVEEYLALEPTPENSPELVADLAEQWELSANSIRLLLDKAGVYVKRVAAAKATTTKEGTTGTKRVSKEAAIKDLRNAIEAKGKEIDDTILEKLTGKAAVYLLSVIQD